jgi:AMP-binding enzyme C-terminal domain
MAGYLGRPEATAAMLGADGWRRGAAGRPPGGGRRRRPGPPGPGGRGGPGGGGGALPRRRPDPEELLAWVAERVAPHKRLRAVRFAEAIPRTASGKLLRRALRDQDRQPV